MNSKDFGWCFIGSGRITDRVLNDLLPYANGSYPAAVYSKTYENALRFARTHGAKAYASADAAMSDPDVKAVYICTTNPSHKDYAIMALRRGLPVLCEKPAALSLDDARRIIAASKDSDAYFMEGMWTRHNPVIKRVLSWIEEGRIGKVRSLSASFSFWHDYNPNSRLFDPAQGGGALYDVGIYVIALSRFVFNEMPESVKAFADFAPSGVDSLAAMIFKYPGGGISRLFAGVSADEPDDAVISGEKGYIRIPHFWAPKTSRLVLKKPDGDLGLEEHYTPGFPGEGFQFEFNAVKDDVLAGRKENSLMTRELTLSMAELMEAAEKSFKA
ncbi:MAG: Gfo/Idh/MocA family oxidoreductase [Clostridiales bacterium]|jgi:predicted dehydrogenase|nr:Gfo/Idh/MocA family oxidoreductase [Clostridiales bacterium]